MTAVQVWSAEIYCIYGRDASFPPGTAWTECQSWYRVKSSRKIQHAVNFEGTARDRGGHWVTGLRRTGRAGDRSSSRTPCAATSAGKGWPSNSAAAVRARAGAIWMP